MGLDNILILLYLGAWSITLFLYIKRYKTFDAIALFYASFVIFSFCSYMAYNSGWYSFKPMSLFPFIYLYVSLFITSYPIRKYSVTTISNIQNPSDYIITGLSIFIIVVTLIHFPTTISKFSSGLAMLMVDNSAINDMYGDSMANVDKSGTGGITNIWAIFSEAFSTIGILLLFYQLTKKKINKWLVIGLGLCTVSGIMTYISMGQRGGVFMRIATLLATYFAFKRFLSSKVNKIARNVLVVLSVLIIIPIAIMTIGRFSTSMSDSTASVYYYVGQQNLYFNNYGLDDNGIRYGDRTFPLFKKMLGFENVPSNFVQRRAKYPQLYVNDEVFISYIGDFTLDFGPIIAALIFILFSVWATNKMIISNRTIKFHQLVLLHFILTMCMQGGIFLFSFGDIAGNLKIMVYVALYLWCLYDSKKTYNNL